MKRRLMFLLSLGVLTSFGSVGCADESAPNRRGIERPPLWGGQAAQDQAEQREEEAPKRDLPTGGKEFPGQSRLDDGGGSVVLLADVGEAVTPSTSAAVTGPNAATTQPAATTGTSADAIATEATATTVIGATAAPADAAIAPAVAPVSDVGTPIDDVITLPPQKPMAYKEFNSNKPYAVPGRVMIVPETGGETIDPSWGEPTVMDNYPHRPYADSAVTYIPGTSPHNPIYYHDLLTHEYQPTQTPNVQTTDALKDVAEIPWFFGETVALPVLMVIDPPLAYRETRLLSGDPLYEGKLPPSGEIMPAPYPGALHWRYPVVDMPPETSGAATQPATP